MWTLKGCLAVGFIFAGWSTLRKLYMFFTINAWCEMIIISGFRFTMKSYDLNRDKVHGMV